MGKNSDANFDSMFWLLYDYCLKFDYYTVYMIHFDRVGAVIAKDF